MRRHRRLCPLQLRLFFFQRDYRAELVRADLVEADPDAQLERRPEIERAPEQETCF